jgi:hypothetical protein
MKLSRCRFVNPTNHSGFYWHSKLPRNKVKYRRLNREILLDESDLRLIESAFWTTWLMKGGNLNKDKNGAI